MTSAHIQQDCKENIATMYIRHEQYEEDVKIATMYCYEDSHIRITFIVRNDTNYSNAMIASIRAQFGVYEAYQFNKGGQFHDWLVNVLTPYVVGKTADLKWNVVCHAPSIKKPEPLFFPMCSLTEIRPYQKI